MRWGVVVAVFAIGFAAFPLRVIGWNAEYLPGDDIDNPLNIFVLEHGYRYITGRAESFWDIPSFYPQPHVTAWSDAHLGMLPIYSAFRAAGLSPERAFQGHFLSSFVLNFLAAAWSLRRLGFGPFGTAAGAYLFTFGLPLVAQLNHAQLFPRFFVPPATVFAWEFLRTARTDRLGACLFCIVGQIYVSVYIGFFLCLLLAAGLMFTAIWFRREVPWCELLTRANGNSQPVADKAPLHGCSKWKQRGLVILGAIIAALPLIVGHARGMVSPPREQVRELAPRPDSWLAPPAAAAVQLNLSGSPREAIGERQLLPGFATLAALGIGLLLTIRPGAFESRRAAVVVAVWSAVTLALIVTRFDEVWLYAPLSYLPGFGGIRAIGRLVLVLLFPAGIVLAAGVDAIVNSRIGKFPALTAGLLALAMIVADHWLTSPEGGNADAWAQMRYPLNHLLARQQQIAEAIRRHPAPTLVYVFPSVAEKKRLGELVVQLEAMRAAQDLGLPCVNGWSGYVPLDWDYFASYRELIAWLTVRHQIPEERLSGTVIVGEPIPDKDSQYEAAMRAKFPPQPLREEEN